MRLGGGQHSHGRGSSPVQRAWVLRAFPHGVLTAPKLRTDRVVARQFFVQAQVPEQVKHLGHRAVPIRLRIGGAPMVTSMLRRGRQLSSVTLTRPRGQRCGKQPALFVMPHRDAIQRFPIVGVIPAGRDVVPQRLLGALCTEGRLDGVPRVRDGGTPRGDGRPVKFVEPVAHHGGRLFLGGDRAQALEQARAQEGLV